MSDLPFETESYLTQRSRWPAAGKHILAHFNADSILVYQAYSPEIALPAARLGQFVAPWSRSRMSWIKPNFLWMMYRSGWGTKQGQEVVLAIRMRRSGFDALLAQAVSSSFEPSAYGEHAEWQKAVSDSDVRLQWDPDHAPHGEKQQRRALQLGLRGDALYRYADEWLLSITDISDFVRTQRTVLQESGISELVTPREHVYPVSLH